MSGKTAVCVAGHRVAWRASTHAVSRHEKYRRRWHWRRAGDLGGCSRARDGSSPRSVGGTAGGSTFTSNGLALRPGASSPSGWSSWVASRLRRLAVTHRVRVSRRWWRRMVFAVSSASIGRGPATRGAGNDGSARRPRSYMSSTRSAGPLWNSGLTLTSPAHAKESAAGSGQVLTGDRRQSPVHLWHPDGASKHIRAGELICSATLQLRQSIAGLKACASGVAMPDVCFERRRAGPVSRRRR